jgi:hypothetical protein
MSSVKKKTDPGYENHGENSQPPSVRKGKFEAVGTYMDAGAMTSTFPKATSPNVKTGTSSGMEQ